MPILTNRTLDRVRHERTALYRDDDTLLLARARRLDRDDRLLIELAVRDRLQRRKLGEIFREHPATVTRRLHRLLARLHDPLVVALLDETRPLAADLRELGLDYFLLRRPLAHIARARGRTLHDVRGVVQFLRGWHRGLASQRDWRSVTSPRATHLPQ
jgi:hypothetical protein